jgi:CheY-like chemotaxis protein
VLDLNETVEGLLKLLHRLIGENIQLRWVPGAGLGPVKLDPTQVDQVLANLCVNARDAIGGVGKITIATENASFDDTYCAEHPGFLPGAYVRLVVSDTGCGMDKATQAQIFEPFFTTKDVGEGTGLGLATVYGIVKQNQGFIHVYSEPGKGTSFSIYLPRHAGQALAAQPKSAAKMRRSTGETVLLVEDEPSILAIAQKVLDRLGYTVLAAATPGKALQLAEAHAGKIHLLMTDVVMPEMNGRDLARELLARKPETKCLFMSGYAADVIVHQGVIEKGVQFIQKPFTMADLAAKVRETLEH